MAYTPHFLFTFAGRWTNEPGEIWECTTRLRSNAGGGVTLDPEAYLEAIKTPFAEWFVAPTSGMHGQAELQTLKCNAIGADGLYVSKSVTHLTDYAPGFTGGKAGIAPGFCSLAFTWETGILRGPGHRGRIYPPNPTGTMASAMRVNAATAEAAALSGRAYLLVLRNAAGADGVKGFPVVASKVDGSIHEITGVTVDDILDVQRRRKNAVSGTRSAVAVVP